MEAISIERQVGGDVSKFYLDTLRWLQVDERIDNKCEDFNRFYCGVRDLVNPNTHFNTLDKLGPSLLYMFLKTRGILIILPEREINKDNVLDAFRNRIEKCYFKPIKMLNDKRFLIGLSLIGSII